MKNNILITILAVSAMSCGGKADKSATVDSISLDSVSIISDTLEAEVEVEPADHVMLQLKGDVKSVEQWYVRVDGNGKEDEDLCEHTLYEFDEKGSLTNVYQLSYQKSNHSKEKLRVKRNNSGQVSAIEWYFADNKCWLGDDYTYDDRGFVVKTEGSGPDGGGTETYTYDSEGNLTKSNLVEFIEGDEYSTESVYSITRKDSHGNWTARKIKSTTKSEYSKDVELKHEYRTINYR